MNQRISIYGAGVSGLFLGYYLKKAGIPFVIYEITNDIGGKIKTKTTPYGIAETAANGVLSSEHLFDLCHDLQLPLLEGQKKLKRLVQRVPGDGHKLLRPAPAFRLQEIFTLVTKIFSSVPSELWKNPHPSLKDFFAPLVGEAYVHEVLSTALQGIYAATADQLDLNSIMLPPLPKESYKGYFARFKKELNRQHFPLKKGRGQTLSFEHGLGQLIEALGGYLRDHIQLKSSPSWSGEEPVVLCMPPRESKEWFEKHRSLIPHKISEKTYEYWRQRLESVTMLPIRTTTFFTNRPIPILQKSFGALFSPRTHYHHLGVLHNSSIFSGRTNQKDHHSYTFIGKNIGQDFEQELHRDLQKLDPHWKSSHLLHIQSTPYQEGIPLYNDSRAEVWNSSFSPEKSSMIQIHSNYTGKIGLRDILLQSKKISDSFKELH